MDPVSELLRQRDTGPLLDQSIKGGRVRSSGAALLLAYFSRLSMAVCLTVLAMWCLSHLWSFQRFGVASVGLACGAVHVTWEDATGLSSVLRGPIHIRSSWQWPTVWAFESSTSLDQSGQGLRHDLVVPLWPFATVAGLIFVLLAAYSKRSQRQSAPTTMGRPCSSALLVLSALVLSVCSSLTYLVGPLVLLAAYSPTVSQSPPLLSMPDVKPRVCRNGVIPLHDYELYNAGRYWQRLTALGGTDSPSPLSVLWLSLVLSLPLMLAALLIPPVSIALRSHLGRWKPMDAPSSWRQESDAAGGPDGRTLLRATMLLVTPMAALLTLYRAGTTAWWSWNIPMSIGRMLLDMTLVGVMATCAAMLYVVWVRWTRLARTFVADRSVCRCGYIRGTTAKCPECGTMKGACRDYFQTIRLRQSALIAAVMVLGVSGLAGLNLLQVRANARASAAAGWALTIMQRLNPTDGTVYLRVPARSRIHATVGKTSYIVELVSNPIAVGPTVNLGADRAFPSSVVGELSIVARGSGIVAGDSEQISLVDQLIPIALERYGPANQTTTMTAGELQLTVGIHMEYLGCIEVLLRSIDGAAIESLSVQRIDASTDRHREDPGTLKPLP